MTSITDKYAALLKKAQQGERPVVFVNACTHGHEQVGVSVVEALQQTPLQKGTLIGNIANERARALNTAFVETDLNRCFPGKENGLYEEQLAHHIHPLVLEADVVIDIHSTNTMSVGKNSAMIVTKLDDATRKLIEAVHPPKVLVMSCTKDNALISDARIGIGIEYGRDKEKQTSDQILSDIHVILTKLGMAQERAENSSWSTSTEWFDVTSVFEKQKGDTLSSGVKNFSLTKKGTLIGHRGKYPISAQEDFYPILFGENRYTDIFGFVGQKRM